MKYSIMIMTLSPSFNLNLKVVLTHKIDVNLKLVSIDSEVRDSGIGTFLKHGGNKP